MKDYEIVEDYERRLFHVRERRSFLVSSLLAMDDGIEEKKNTFEAMVEDYNEQASRIQATLLKLDAEIKDLEEKLGIAKETQKINSHKGRKKKKEKKPEPKPEPKPVFIEKESEKEIEEIIEEPIKKETNGKKPCPICGKEFSKQGFSAHYKSCLRKEMESLPDEGE